MIINSRGDLLRWRRNILCPLKLALTLPTSAGRCFGIVRWRTKAPEYVYKEWGLHFQGSLYKNLNFCRFLRHWNFDKEQPNSLKKLSFGLKPMQLAAGLIQM
jgi:hypothetical protein